MAEKQLLTQSQKVRIGSRAWLGPGEVEEAMEADKLHTSRRRVE